jgi:NTE family protein
MNRLGRVAKALLLILTVPLQFAPAAAQDAPTKRQSVGIALSGGGALGLAHIGVLRYLEEHRIPVDMIAGTSMGGILGGLYATGHDAANLEGIVKRANWNDLLRTTPRFEDRPAAEKQEWNRVTGPYSIPLRAGFDLPGGINSGQPLVRLISGETAAYWDVNDFDNLPIPFRCVTVDLSSGEEFVVRGDGHLAEALRATMAIPGIFTPVEWKGRLLADGGLVNNLPTDVAKQMGADIVIGVTLRLPPVDAASLHTLPSVVRQTMNIAVMQNEMRNVTLANIEIKVQLSRNGLMEFNDTQPLIEAGYKAAQEKQSELEKLSLSPSDWEAHLRYRKSRERAIPPSGKVVDVVAGEPGIKRNAESEIARKTGPDTSVKSLEATLSGLTAATGLPNAYYGWHSESTGEGYQIKLETRRSVEIVLRPSFFYHLSSGEPGRPTLKLSASAVTRDSYKSRFLTVLNLGSNPALYFEYFHPFGGSPYFIAPGIALERTHFSRYFDDDRVDEVRNRFAGSLYFGIGTWRHLQLRIGARAGLDRYSDPVVVNGIETTDTAFANPEITGIINSQDSGAFPSRGLRLNASSGWSFREHSFPYLELNLDHFQPIGQNFSAVAMGRADTSMGRNLGFYDQFTAGGLNQLDAYRFQEIRGDTLLMAGGGLLYRGLNPNTSQLRPIFGAWYQAASIDSLTNSSQVKQSASVGVFTPTPLGIAGLAFSFDLDGSTRFRLSLGSFWNRP